MTATTAPCGPQQGGPQPWGPLQTFGLATVVYAVYVFAYLILIHYLVVFEVPSGVGATAIQLEDALAKFSLSLTVVLIFACGVGGLLLLFFCRLRRGMSIVDYLALKPVGAKAFLFWLAAGGLLFATMYVLDTTIGIAIARPIFPMLMAPPGSIMPLLLALVVIFALFDETLFRGFLFRGLINSRIGMGGAILVSAVAWAVLPTPFLSRDPAAALALGILLGLARAKSGSIYVTAVLNGLFALVGLTAALLAG